VIAIASSLGGAAGLRAIVEALPAELDVPVLLAHHQGWNDPMIVIDAIQRRCSVRVRVGVSGEKLRSGIFVAPAGSHLIVTSDRRILTPHWGHLGYVCPSADLLFLSVARAFGPAAVGVVLSGLGSDGARGCREIRTRGGFVLAESAASAPHFDMPGAAIETRKVDVVTTRERIAAALAQLAAPREPVASAEAREASAAAV
jgi:chemotaxis response regulator CheB